MNLFFTPEEGSLILRLLIAHCLTDFFLQPDKWVAGKREKVWRSKYLWWHGLLTGAIAWLFLFSLDLWWAVLLITGSHLLIDAVKLQLEKKLNGSWSTGLLLFLGDQLLHVFILFTSWLWVINGWDKMAELFRLYLPDYRLLLMILGYLIMIGPVGYIIQFLTRKWLHELNLNDSLKDAGKWIGILERVLTLTFVYTHQFGAIGFLITAKSVLRLIDKPERTTGDPTWVKPFSSRKHTEYVLIGTFISFAIAILTGLFINWILSF